MIMFIWLGVAWMGGLKYVYAHYLDQQYMSGNLSEEQIAKNKEHAFDRMLFLANYQHSLKRSRIFSVGTFEFHAIS